jgi:anti-sigma factor ChrR (cupin superfamily)
MADPLRDRESNYKYVVQAALPICLAGLIAVMVWSGNILIWGDDKFLRDRYLALAAQYQALGSELLAQDAAAASFVRGLDSIRDIQDSINAQRRSDRQFFAMLDRFDRGRRRRALALLGDSTQDLVRAPRGDVHRNFRDDTLQMALQETLNDSAAIAAARMRLRDPLARQLTPVLEALHAERLKWMRLGEYYHAESGTRLKASAWTAVEEAEYAHRTALHGVDAVRSLELTRGRVPTLPVMERTDLRNNLEGIREETQALFRHQMARRSLAVVGMGGSLFLGAVLAFYLRYRRMPRISQAIHRALGRGASAVRRLFARRRRPMT